MENRPQGVFPTPAELGLLFDRNPLPMWLVEPVSQRILAANEAALREYGYSRHEFLEMRVEDLGELETEPRSSVAAPLPVDGGDILQRVSTLHVTADGRNIDVDLIAQVFPWRDSRLLLLTAQNVTSRRRAADRLLLVHAVTAALAEALTPEQVAAAVIDEGVRALGAHSGSLSVVVEGRFLQIVRAAGYTDEMVETWQRRSIDESFPLAEAVRTRSPIFLSGAAERAERYPHLTEIRGAASAGPLAAVPLLVEGEAIGGIGLSFPYEFTLGGDERALILNIAQQAAQALHRARLFAEESRSRDSAERLRSLAAALSQAATEEEVADVTVRSGMGAIGASSGILVQPDESARVFRITCSVGYPEEATDYLQGIAFEADVPLAVAFRTRQPIVLGSFAARERAFPHLAGIWRRMQGEALACLPLLLGERTLGALAFNFRDSRAFTGEDMAFLQALSQQAGQALERAALFTALRLSRDEARMLAEASRTLSSSLDYEQTLATVASLAVPSFADWCAVDLLLPDGSISRAATVHRDAGRGEWAESVARSVAPRVDDAAGVGKVIQSGQPIFVPSVDDETILSLTPAPAHAHVVRALEVRSAILVPMGARGKVFGALSFFHAESGRSYGENDLATAVELARRAAVAIENSMLYSGELEARAEAERASLAKSQFLAVMSHELRTPLNAILGYADLLAAEVSGGLNEKQHAHMSRILESARHLRELIDQVLSLARIEAGREEVNVEEVGARELVTDVISIVRPLALQKGLDLQAASGEEIRLRSDAGKVKQVLINLVGNSIKYSEVGSIRIVISTEEGRVRFEVVDTGVGIAAEDLERIFEPFTQVDQSTTRRVGGSGLGLPISRKLARLMGGDITVRSVPGEGSTFLLELPIDIESEGLPAPSSILSPQVQP